ncbi:Ig-like domain-containing protein [Paenibacillus sp. MER TA 81-3]|uniref:SwmB domain-containing protein n=1 Tax=Paenibacillus sp. MER TA 81-3 TaxID=2939573 RepID=UPI00204136F7|nr:SwmB domain-containing protein [Paenibacillus sp. MER TA 81-3]MCM3339486.1 Ig-like domain-containing protein [Paenibacillus sp. MER TA 81-3]
MKRTLAILLTVAMAMELSMSTAFALSPDEVKQTNKAWHNVKVEATYPRSGTNDVDVQSELSIQFQEQVEIGTGNVTIKTMNGEVVEAISVQSDQVKLDDAKRTATIKPSKSLHYRTKYIVQVDYGTFKVENGEFLGIYDPVAWTFATKAEQGLPVLSKLSPAQEQRDVRVDANLELTFNENVWKKDGSVIIKTAKDGKVAEALPMSSGRIAGDGTKTISIDPVQDLRGNTDYVVEISAGALKNESSKDYAGLKDWRFSTGKQDVTAPVLKSAGLTASDTIRLTYDESLDKASVPSASRFTVTVNGDARRVKSVAVSGEHVDVKLQSGIAYGQEVRLSYSPGSDRKPIRDTSGNAAASIDRWTVANTVDNTLPSVRNVTAQGNKVELEFTKELDAVSSKADGQFTVWADGKERRISRISHNGSKVTLSIIHLITNGEVVKVSYKPDKYPLKDRGGNQVQAFSDLYARNLSDTKAPVLRTAEVNGSTLKLIYDEALKADQVPLRSHYSVLVNRSARYVSAVNIKSNVVELTLDSSVGDNDEVTVSYAPGEPRLADLAGNPAASFTLVRVDNKSDNQAPTLRSAIIKGATMTLTFSEKLRETPTPTLSQFYVQADNSNQKVKSASIKGDQITLTLTDAVSTYSNVTLAYLPGANPVKDRSGNALQAFSNAAVSNQTDGSMTRPDDIQPAAYEWFLDNGWYLLASSAAETKSERSRFGETVKRYTLPSSKLKSSFDYVIKNGTRNHLAFDVPASERAAMVAVPLQTLKEVYNQVNDAVFSVRYGDVLYSVPLKELNFRDLEREWGNSTAYLLLQVEKQPSSSADAMLRDLNSTGANVRVQPLDFYASTFAGSASPKALAAKLESKVRTTGYVQRHNASAVRYDSVLNKVGYVPTVVKQNSSITVFSSTFKGNQAVAMMDRSKDFIDAANHWGREAIRELASKYIIEGVSSTSFAPNANITRGQFAILLARSLGLQANSGAAAVYRDVSSNSMMAPYIGAATEAGIIGGFEDRTFRPNESINREQMAVMLVRAMEYTGHTVSYEPASLNKFKDRNNIGGYAQQGVAKAISTGIVQGMTVNTFEPKGTATRAQAAVMLKRMLEQIEYLG